MKVLLKGNEQISSMLPLQTLSYKLDTSAEAVALIAETLRSNYSDPIKTSVQEYLSNARDVHRETNTTKAIDVQIPTDLNPEFYIRDYGTGLSVEQMQDFITFAKSTKRHTNEQTGGFGYGSKSFFAYADSFTIISYHKGIRYTWRSSIVASKEGNVILINKTPTSEPDGLKVQVAVRKEDRRRFLDAVLRLKTHWTQEIKILNINEDEYTINTPVKDLGDVKIWKSNDNYSSSLFLVIDGVPYDLGNMRQNPSVTRLTSKITRGHKISIEVITGEMELSKYREFVMDTPANVKSLESLIKKAEDSLIKFQSTTINKDVLHKISDINNAALDSLFSINNELTLKCSIGGQILDISVTQTDSTRIRLNIPSPTLIEFVTNNKRLTQSGKIATNGMYYHGHFSFINNYKNNTSINLYLKNKDQIYLVDTEESSLIQNQRVRTLLNNKNYPSIMLIQKNENREFSKMEQGIIDFFEIKKISTIERTLPEKKEKGSCSPKKKINKPIGYKSNYEGFKTQTALSLKDITQPTFYCVMKRSSYPDYFNKKTNRLIQELGFKIIFICKKNLTVLENHKNCFNYENINELDWSFMSEKKTISSVEESICSNLHRNKALQFIQKNKSYLNQKEISILNKFSKNRSSSSMDLTTVSFIKEKFKNGEKIIKKAKENIINKYDDIESLVDKYSLFEHITINTSNSDIIMEIFKRMSK